MRERECQHEIARLRIRNFSRNQIARRKHEGSATSFHCPDVIYESCEFHVIDVVAYVLQRTFRRTKVRLVLFSSSSTRLTECRCFRESFLLAEITHSKDAEALPLLKVRLIVNSVRPDFSIGRVAIDRYRPVTKDIRTRIIALWNQRETEREREREREEPQSEIRVWIRLFLPLRKLNFGRRTFGR
jgi:hypothetical protein